MLNIDQLKMTHEAYADVVERADYLYRSYIGGELYRDGNYLTHYHGEEDGQYMKRLSATPLNNYVKTTVDIYRSFLFRELPTRATAGLEKNPLFAEWMTDTDQEGQGMDSFMKSVNDMAMVLGSMWLLVDKPAYQVETAAQEIALGIRPYVCAYTPQNVLDWEFERGVNGKRQLVKIKVVESNNSERAKITCWYPDYIAKYTVSKDSAGDFDEIIEYAEYQNPLGYIPFVQYVPTPSPIKGVGYSLVEDVADIQKYIYNLASELEQTIRISGHPTLVKTAETRATAGAGSIVTIPADQDPGLNPYLLQPAGATVTGILATIESQVEAILRMTHTGAVQSQKGQPMSGVAIATERQLLNAKLSDISDTLEETEMKLHRIWADWQNITLPEGFHIDYADSFDMRDKHVELELLMKARSAGVMNPKFTAELDKQVIELIVDDTGAVADIMMEYEDGFEPHVMIDPSTGAAVDVTSQQQHEDLAAQGYE